jgi:uncharacterized surface protein with fasciclin (FAS1) repeats
MKTMPHLAAILALGISQPALADHHGSQTIAEVAMASPQHETLVAAVKAAGLAGALGGSGPLTVFAPTDQAFENLPEGTVDTLLQTENKAQLQSVLKYHVVSGRLAAADIVRMIESGGGTATLTTLEGGTLLARLSGDKVTITDDNGGTATVLMADIKASNGIVHATDAVSLPS